jgi:large subunit ribosomal protein L31
MQPTLHNINVSCTCGNKFKLTTTLENDFNVESCNKCHPAYTGQRRVAMTGAIDRFAKKYAAYSTNLTSSTGNQDA